MTQSSPNLRLKLTEFLNLYPQRAPHLMWFFGAGASVSAGLPSGGTLIWEFKRALYCNAERIPPTRFRDLNDESFQRLVQPYFDSKSGFPSLGDNEEYSAYFEAYLPDERDRRRFLEGRLQNRKPSYGHLCLAALMCLDRVRVIWTTNFDHLIETACGHSLIADKLPRALAVAGLECPDKASDLLRDESWPLLIKLHGDFQYRKLKNTAPELQQQDETLRYHLTDESARRGLVVVGYSGRDRSVMDALLDALQEKNPFPHGLYWFVRPSQRPLPEVVALVERARELKAQAALVEVDTFDELMAGLFLPYQDSFSEIRDLVKAARPRAAPLPAGSKVSAGTQRSRSSAQRVNRNDVMAFLS